MNKASKIIITVLIWALFIALFIVLVGVTGHPGIIGLAFAFGAIGATKAVWKKHNE
jgi:hypothetical protein